MVNNIEILFNCTLSSAETVKTVFDSIQKLNIDWTKVYIWNWSLDEESKDYINCKEAEDDYILNLKKYDISLNCTKKIGDIKTYKLLVQNYGKEKIALRFVCKAPNFTLEQFHYYEQFFYDIYQSLDSKIYYKSFVGVASKNKFYRENGLRDKLFYNDPFLEETFCYRCLTPKSVYGEWHTKEQLLQAPFYSIKELANETLEIIQFEHPIDITNTQHIENMRSLRIYLSEHNTYPED